MGGQKPDPAGQQALHAQALLAAIVESSDDAIISESPHGMITSWNKASERIFGYTAEEAIGQHISLLAVPGNSEDMEQILAKIRQGGRVDHYETRRRAKDGRILDVSLSVSPIRDSHGTVVGASKISRDITERKRSELELAAQRELVAQQRELLEVTLSSIGDAVITTDAHSRTTFVNRVAEQLTGWSRSDAAGMPLEEVFHIINEQTRERAPNPAQRALAHGTIVGLANHTVLIARDGTERPIDDSAAPIKDAEGAVYGAVLVFRDIGQRRMVEKRLREADRRKDEFLAMLAHELRNPLSSISNAVRLARETSVKEDLGWAEAVIERQLQNLTRLIDDLLDVSRITQGKIQLRTEPLDLVPVIQASVQTVRPLVEARSLHIAVVYHPGPLWVRGDPTRLDQVLLNLLSNAAKYTPAGGHIWLTAERAGDRVVIRVRDDGVGIPPEIMPQMFELFAQGERSLARSEGGLGIGLTLVKRLTELHGGTVTATSEGPGKGSEFTVTLPAAEAPRWLEAESEPVQRAAATWRILIVDDNADTARTLAKLLSLHGHEVHVATDGPAAMELARVHPPEYVLMDIGLPGMDGIELTRALRHEPCCKDAVFVAVTGYGEEATRRRAREAGFDHHLVKPIDLDVLLALMARRGPSGRNTPEPQD